jgi:hypothetical protein
MKQPFELEWMGGPAEHHFRRARPGIEEMPWGTLDTSAYPPDVLLAARATWTEAAYTEYKAVAAFSEVLRALCEAKAPLDLIGMASSFVADEVVHVELCSRLAMELGGGVPRPVDFDALTVKADPARTAFERANEMVLRISCIAEAFSGKLAASALRSTTHPLTRAVLERIVADESLHYRLGGLYFEWASEQLEDAERIRLSAVAVRALGAFAPMWRDGPTGAQPPAVARDEVAERSRAGRRRATLEQVHEIGWIESRLYKEQAHAALRDAVAQPLASYGIEIPEEQMRALLAG